MSQLFRNYPNARRMLQRIPAEIRATFTPIQIQSIETALVPRTHAVDVRLSLPLFGSGAYLVFAAGPNRRMTDRNFENCDPAMMPAVLSSVINMSQSFRQIPHAYRMLQRMPREISTTFTLPQIQAIEKALIPSKHIVDMRLSLPLLGKGAYLIFAAGPNRRAHYRDLQNRHPLVMPTVFGSVMIGAGAILGLVYLNGSQVFAEPDEVFQTGEAFYPTVVPFKVNRQECEASDRRWLENQCVDDSHDPVF
jgi:hypothetical protein